MVLVLVLVGVTFRKAKGTHVASDQIGMKFDRIAYSLVVSCATSEVVRYMACTKQHRIYLP